MASLQGTALPERAALAITIGGDNVTATFRPFLISVQAIDKDSGIGEMDECLIELDDSYGQLRIPDIGETIVIRMGWVGGSTRVVFNGIVSDVESGFTRGSGRRLFIQGKGSDPTGLGKQQFSGTWGDGKTADIPLSTPLTEAAAKAGFSIVLAPSLGSIVRKFWSQDRESFWNFGQRLAHELGGSFKVAGTIASMSSATEQVNALGEAMAIVRAVWGDNLIQWRIRPNVGRPQLGSVISEWFDPDNAVWQQASKNVEGFKPFLNKAEHLVRWAAGAEDQAQQDPGGAIADSERKRGTGWVLINGDPMARAGGTVIIAGARPGVDGGYRITEAEHTWGRDSGYLTRMDVENPSSGVGLDGRGGPI